MKKVMLIGNNSRGLFRFRGMLISKLVSEGNDVVVLTSFDSNVDDIEKLGARLVETALERRGLNPIADLKLYYKYRKIIKEENPDIVITYTIKPNIYGGLACQRMNIPYAANITGLGSTFQNDGLLKKLVTLMYKIGLKKAKTVFFENEENRQILLNENIVKMNQTCLLSGAGVDLEFFQITEYPKNAESTRFLFVGRVMKEKGIEELLEVMRKLVYSGINCSLDILGLYEEDYKMLVEKHESEGWLHYCGEQDDVRPYIEKCHCFVLPSWHEGMANTNLECAAMGRPVITSNIHGCMEAVEDGVSGYLFECKNVDSLYEKMKLFTELSYEQRKNMGLAGRKRMEEIFDKKKVVAKTIENL